MKLFKEDWCYLFLFCRMWQYIHPVQSFSLWRYFQLPLKSYWLMIDLTIFYLVYFFHIGYIYQWIHPFLPYNPILFRIKVFEIVSYGNLYFIEIWYNIPVLIFNSIYMGIFNLLCVSLARILLILFLLKELTPCWISFAYCHFSHCCIN